MQDWARRIVAWAAANADRLGLPVDADPQVSRLGAGESYDAWLVEGGAAALVVRCARRPPDQLPRPMAAQLAALPLVPDGIGPRAVLVEESSGPLGTPFVVTSYVPGREIARADWTDDLLVAHARQLATLHSTPYERCGDLPAPDAERFSLVGRNESALTWWHGHHPDVFDDPDVTALAPRVAAYLAAAEPAFARVQSFALVHGDLCVTNIVVDASGVPRYIDWEWAEIGDPAQDLALLGGAIAPPPWYLPLDGPRLELVLAAYGADDELAIRRDAYEVFERFVSSLYYRLRAGEPYRSAVRQITDGLTARLG